jgi:branched-chain amino acid transport system ATP-binding protein
MILEVKDLHVSYGAINAVKGVSFNVEKGEIVTLIGANGAGKSTTLRTISGLEKANRGTISYMGKDITNMPPAKIVGLGISHVPEGRKIFANLSIMNNLKLGANLRKDADGIRKDMKWVFELFPILEQRQNQMSGTLSGGEQQMLAVGRALMTKGELMLLDEPSMGLAPLTVEKIFNVIEEINKQGVTILLVEQNAFMALSIAHRAYVLQTGNIVMQGEASKLKEDDRVKTAYLGV